MPVYGPRSDRDLHDSTRVTLSGGAVVSHGAIILDPKDRTPNRGWKDLDRRGLPEGWGILLPPAREATHFHVSRPGNRPAGAGVPTAQTEPPRRDTLTDQTPEGLRVGKNWIHYQELSFGWQPEFLEERRSVLGRPQDGPTLSVYASGEKGFPADTYGVRVDFRPTKNPDRRTTPSGYSFVTLSAGQGFKVYVPPEARTGGAIYMGIYVTQPGTSGAAGTDREQAVRDIRHTDSRGFVTVDGPYDDNGRRPATVDQSGAGRPPAPLRHRRPGRAYCDIGGGRWTLAPGKYQFGYIRENSRGQTLLSELTKTKTINNPREKVAFWFLFPGLPEGQRVIPVVYYEPLGVGVGSYYMVYDTHGPTGPEAGYGSHAMKRGVPIYGPDREKTPATVQHRLAEFSPPGEDTSGIPSPDEVSGPSVVPYGLALLTAPASYLVATSDEDELGYESPLSPTSSITLASLGQGIRATPYLPGNRLRNPEGAQRGAAGGVVAWNGPWSNATSTATFRDGSLRVIGSGLGVPVAPISDPVPIPSADSDVSVRAQMRLGRDSTASQVFIRYYDASGAQVGTDVTLLQAASAGQISNGPQGTLFGPNGKAIPDGVVSLAIGFKATSASWNGAAYVENMAIFFHPTALRKVERVGPDQPVVFDPTASANSTRAGVAQGYPYGSISALGPISTAEEQPPASIGYIEQVDFEGGVWPGSGTTAWSTAPFSNNGTQNISSASPIFGSHSVFNNSTNTASVRRVLRRRTYTNAEVGGASQANLHVRVYERWITRPSVGEILRLRINDASGMAMASVYESPRQIRLYRHDASGERVDYAVGLAGVTDGSDVDFELSVISGDSANGQIILSAGLNGNPRTRVASFGNRNFVGRKPRQVDIGYEQTRADAINTDKMDNILVTRNGAPLYYETQSAPSGTTVPASPPPPEAPPDGSGNWRLYDQLGDAINQWWFWIEPGTRRPPDTKYGPYTKDHIHITPGETITHAVQGGWTFHEEPEAPSHQFFVVLHGPGREPLRVGSPFASGRDATTVSRVGGSRMNRTAAEGMASAAGGQNAQDFWQTFVVPEGYYWATIEPRRGTAGYYFFQEHLFAKGNLNTQSARDEARDFTRATSGSAAVVIRAAAAANPYGWAQNAERLYLGVEPGSIGEGASLANILYSSGPSASGPFSATTANPALVPENTYYRISFDITGEADYGGDAPRVRADGIYVSVKPFLSVLLREDRHEIHGAIFVDGVDVPDNRPRTNQIEVDGDVYAPRTSRRVRYMTRDLTIHISSQAQKRFLEMQRPDSVLVIEAPFLSGSGRILAIRPGTNITVQTDNRTAFIQGARRRVYGTATIPAGAAQVIEFGPLIGPS